MRLALWFSEGEKQGKVAHGALREVNIKGRYSWLDQNFTQSKAVRSWHLGLGSGVQGYTLSFSGHNINVRVFHF